MPDDPLLKLLRVRNPEPERRWEEMPTPDEVLTWMLSHLAVDARALKPFAGVIVSGSVPLKENRGKLWVKTSEPVGVGVFVNGQWQMTYKYPPNTAFLWTQGANKIPATGYIFQLSEAEVTELGLPAIAEGKTGIWVEFRPPLDGQIANV